MRRLLTPAIALFASLLPAQPASADWGWPLRGDVITPYRNGGDPYASGQHRGIDIAGDAGATVVAAAGGEVRFAGTAGSSGLTVSIRTADGRYDTSYLHLASAAVREGDRVATGTPVGTVGTSGTRSAAAPHLHFGVRDAGSRHAYHDPLTFLPPPGAAPQGPRETPAPQPAPAPVSPAPAPVGAPAPRRVPIGAPHGRRVPVGAPQGRRVPVSAPHGRRLPAAPSERRSPASAGGDEPARTPGFLDAPRRASSQRTGGAEPAGAAPPAPQTRPSPSPGPDLGLLLACLGLLGAAATLGLSKDGRSATRATRTRLASVLRPLLGRR